MFRRILMQDCCRLAIAIALLLAAVATFPAIALCDMPPEPPGTNLPAPPQKKPVKPRPSTPEPNPFPGNGSGARPK